jgi:hypothetical protein
MYGKERAGQGILPFGNEKELRKENFCLGKAAPGARKEKEFSCLKRRGQGQGSSCLERREPGTKFSHFERREQGKDPPAWKGGGKERDPPYRIRGGKETNPPVRKEESKERDQMITFPYYI